MHSRSSARPPDKRPAGYAKYATYHPTFLYESLWCVLAFGVIMFVDRRFRLRKGQSAALYVPLYCTGRFVFENIRIDKATAVFGVRFNAGVAAILCVFGVLWFVYLARWGTPYPGVRRVTAEPKRGACDQHVTGCDPS